MCPRADLDEVSGALLSVFPQFQYRFSTDEQVAVQLGYKSTFGKISAWFRQQLIKLSISSEVAAEIVLVLDADVVAAKKLEASDISIGTLPYQVMGMEEFRGWFEMSAATLGVDFASLDSRHINCAMGVTPEFFVAGSCGRSGRAPA